MSGQGKELLMLGKEQHRSRSFLLSSPQLPIYRIVNIFSAPKGGSSAAKPRAFKPSSAS